MIADTHDRQWKTRGLFEILRTHFPKFYSLSEHFAVDKVVVKFKGRVIFKQYILKYTNILASKCTNCMIPLVASVTQTCTWVKTADSTTPDSNPLH
jgi:hypothetical protein